jgi:hypothetical protein
MQPKVKSALHEIWQAPTKDEANKAFDLFEEMFEDMKLLVDRSGALDLENSFLVHPFYAHLQKENVDHKFVPKSKFEIYTIKGKTQQQFAK